VFYNNIPVKSIVENKGSVSAQAHLLMIDLEPSHSVSRSKCNPLPHKLGRPPRMDWHSAMLSQNGVHLDTRDPWDFRAFTSCGCLKSVRTQIVHWWPRSSCESPLLSRGWRYIFLEEIECLESLKILCW